MEESKHILLITADELSEMVIKQEELNIKYSGAGWRQVVKSGDAHFALLDEVSEFLREIESDWKWWKTDVKYDKQKALFELIDVIHFGLMLVLHRNPVEQVTRNINQYDICPASYGYHDDKNLQFAITLTRFTGAVYEDRLYRALVSLANLIQSGGEILGLRPGDISYAYGLKNSINHNRVTSGDHMKVTA